MRTRNRKGAHSVRRVCGIVLRDRLQAKLDECIEATLVPKCGTCPNVFYREDGERVANDGRRRFEGKACAPLGRVQPERQIPAFGLVFLHERYLADATLSSLEVDREYISSPTRRHRKDRLQPALQSSLPKQASKWKFVGKLRRANPHKQCVVIVRCSRPE